MDWKGVIAPVVQMISGERPRGMGTFRVGGLTTCFYTVLPSSTCFTSHKKNFFAPFSHLTEKETEDQSGRVPYPRSHS